MTRKNIHEEFMKYFTKLFTYLSFFIYSPVYVVEEYWRICEVYVTVYCLKFYIILTKFKSVWIYRKLWRIFNNRMTLNAIEIWNLNRFKGTYKHEKIKNQKQRKKRKFFMSSVDEKVQDGFTSLLSWNAKRIFVSTNATGKTIIWKLVSYDQYNFLNTLCNSWIFYADTFPILW